MTDSIPHGKKLGYRYEKLLAISSDSTFRFNFGNQVLQTHMFMSLIRVFSCERPNANNYTSF